MTNLDTVSSAVFQSQAQHFTNIIRWLIIGWASSVIALGAVLYVDMAYEDDYEVTTETETHSEDYDANADNSGNAIIGDGDIHIGTSESPQNDDENEDDR